MPTIISSQGATRPAPRWWRNLERVLLLIVAPAAGVIIHGWGFSPEVVTKADLIVIAVFVPIVKAIGIMLVDPDDNYVSNLPEKEQNKIDDINTPPVKTS